MFAALGAFVFRWRWLVLAGSSVFLAAALVMLLHGGDLAAGEIYGLEAGRAQAIADGVTGFPADTTFLAVFRDPSRSADGTSPASPGRGQNLDDPGFAAAMQEALEPLYDDPRVAGVLAPQSLPPAFGARMIDAPRGTAYALVTMKGSFQRALKSYRGVREHLKSPSLEIACTGRVPYMFDLDETLEHDLLRAELISLPLALFVLLLVFRTAVAATLPVGVGGLAVVGGIAAVMVLSHVTEIAQYTVNVCSLIGLGVAIDYSLFMVSRYREELAAGQRREAALVRAVDRAGRVVTFSGIAVAAGLAGLLFFEGSYLRSMGLGGVLVVALAVVFALTFLPALLAVLGDAIHAGRLPLPLPSTGRFWHTAATGVMKRPLVFLLPTLGTLLVMGVPFLHLRLATADVRVLSSASEARRAYDTLRAHFPDMAGNRITLAVSFPGPPVMRSDRVAAIEALTRRIESLPHVVHVESPLREPLPVGADALVLYVITDTASDSERSRDVVRALRADPFVADGSLSVGGETAKDIDTTAYVLARAPRAVALVVGAMTVVLFLLLGSVVLPIKAVIMNFVSIAGSFGALVWVFQDGHLFVREPRPVEPSLPILLFCVLFGLSMDYEVLMLSRMKESYARTGDNTAAVAEGLEKTAGLITSAAAIMVSVFGAFALASVVLVQAVGFGMSLAVALDATLVRVLLVPSTMRLFGHLNWWAPGPLLRVRTVLGLDVEH
jgi:RND superfamily putative drug exporter